MLPFRMWLVTVTRGMLQNNFSTEQNGWRVYNRLKPDINPNLIFARLDSGVTLALFATDTLCRQPPSYIFVCLFIVTPRHLSLLMRAKGQGLNDREHDMLMII